MDSKRKLLTTGFSADFVSFDIPSVSWHYIRPEDASDYEEVKGKIFFTECARCKERIFVRASEYPYIRRKGPKIAFLCKSCDPLFVDIGPMPERPREHFSGLWEK